MFPKNAMVYRLRNKFSFDLEKLPEQLKETEFTPCKEQDRQKFGWVTPMGKYGSELIHLADHHLLLCIKKEIKKIPPATWQEALNEKIQEREEKEKVVLKKAEKDAMKDAVMQELLPRAFSQSSFTYLYCNLKTKLVLVDCSSYKIAEDALALLRKTIGSLPVVPALPEKPIETVLTEWVKHNDLPPGFSFCEDVKLKSVLQNGGIATFKQQDVGSDEVKSCIDANKVVTEARLNWQDRLEFTILENGAIKRLKFSDELKDENDDIPREDQAACFDADYCLASGEIEAFLDSLYEGLGGLSKGEVQTSESGDLDSLIEKAKEHMAETRKASVSNLQRKFKIGYNRAAALMGQLENIGVVSASGHNGIREVLIAPKEAE